MITDTDRQLLIPSLDDVLGALSTAPAPSFASWAPVFIKVQVREARGRLSTNNIGASCVLRTPEIGLERRRFIDEHGREQVCWAVTQMPKFYVG